MDLHTLMWIDDKGGFDAVVKYLSSQNIEKDSFDLCVMLFFNFHEGLFTHDWTEKDTQAAASIIQKYEEGFYQSTAHLNHLILCIFTVIKR